MRKQKAMTVSNATTRKVHEVTDVLSESSFFAVGFFLTWFAVSIYLIYEVLIFKGWKPQETMPVCLFVGLLVSYFGWIVTYAAILFLHNAFKPYSKFSDEDKANFSALVNSGVLDSKTKAELIIPGREEINALDFFFIKRRQELYERRMKKTSSEQQNQSYEFRNMVSSLKETNKESKR